MADIFEFPCFLREWAPLERRLREQLTEAGYSQLFADRLFGRLKPLFDAHLREGGREVPTADELGPDLAMHQDALAACWPWLVERFDAELQRRAAFQQRISAEMMNLVSEGFPPLPVDAQTARQVGAHPASPDINALRFAQRRA